MVKQEIKPLSYRPRDAARALGISERTLWAWTKAKAIPHIKRGRMTLYPRDLLEQWLHEQARQQEGGVS